MHSQFDSHSKHTTIAKTPSSTYAATDSMAHNSNDHHYHLHHYQARLEHAEDAETQIIAMETLTRTRSIASLCLRRIRDESLRHTSRAMRAWHAVVKNEVSWATFHA